MAAEWILVLILSFSLMGTALLEMVTHGFICVTIGRGVDTISSSAVFKNYRILCGRQWEGHALDLVSVLEQQCTRHLKH